MKKLSLEQMENVEGGKFWGKKMECTDNTYCDTYYCVFWVCWWTGMGSAVY